MLEGNSVSEALARHGQAFNGTFIASIAAGEASGRVPEVLRQLAELLRGELRLRNSLRTMLAYPILLTGVSGTVLLALVLFVLPKFAEIFSDFDAPLPAITQVLIAVSSELRMHWWLWVPLFAGAGGGLWMFRRSAAGQRLWDRCSLRIPVLREVTRSLLAARMCRLLGLMIESGVPLLDSLRLVRAAVNNQSYRDLFDRLENDVLNGRGLSTGLLQSEFVPQAAAEMMVTAEKTGTLGSVTGMVGVHFEEEGEAKLKEVVSYLEPIITVVMGVLVAVIVMSVMLPLFDLSSAVKG